MKENLTESKRFQLTIATIVFDALVLLLPSLGMDVDHDVLFELIKFVTFIMATLILGRSIRNTPISGQLTQRIKGE